MVADVDVLEVRMLLTSDFGDAPDTTAATGVKNYQTLAANGGPSHVIDVTQSTLFLGGGVDGETGTQQSIAANLDNLFTTGRNDEDGVMSLLDLTATIGSSPKITLSATNTTGKSATLYGWIDHNHNGLFENGTERAQITVPTGTFVDSQDNTITVINILQLNPDGTLKHAKRLFSDTGGDPALTNLSILTGVTAIGDIDGDGINDLAVSGQEREAIYFCDDQRHKSAQSES